jgi:hypothetical protein
LILSRIGCKEQVLPEVRISVNISFHFASFTPIHRSRTEPGVTERVFRLPGKWLMERNPQILFKGVKLSNRKYPKPRR